MKKSALAVSLIIGCSILLVACASSPTAEITATKAAVAAAQTDEVRTYAADSLKAAEDEMSKALAEIQTQLKSAKDLADKAVGDAQANKAKAKSDAEAILATLPQAIEEAKKALAKAPKGKDTKADLEAMQNDLKVAEESLAEANTAMSNGQYKDALAKAESAKQTASLIIEQVQKALEKVKGRR